MDPRKGKRAYQALGNSLGQSPRKTPNQPNQAKSAISAQNPKINMPSEATQGPKTDQPIPSHRANNPDNVQHEDHIASLSLQTNEEPAALATSSQTGATLSTKHKTQDQVHTDTSKPIADITKAVITLRPDGMTDTHYQALVDSLFTSDATVCKRYGWSVKAGMLSRLRAKHKNLWDSLVIYRDRIPAAMAESAQFDGTMLIEEYLQASRNGKNPIGSVKDASLMASLVTQVAKIARDTPAAPASHDPATQSQVESGAIKCLGRLESA